jgi:MFS family permease
MAAESSISAVPLTQPPARPTRVRYGVLAFLGALAFVLYLDRVCISKAAPQIERDLNLSDTLMGFVFGAFTLAYGLFQVPVGRWGDRYGSRGVLLGIALWWSAFTVLTGWAWSFPGGFVYLLVVRFLFGAGEAGALPNSARVIARWFPPASRGPAQGFMNTAMQVGGAATPVLAAYLIKEIGWRWSFALFGALGVLWAAAFALWYRDDPALHPTVNEAERRLIRGSGALSPAEEHAAVPWRRVLTSKNVWLLGGIISCSAFVSYIYFFWYPTYLEKGRGVDPILSGWLSGGVLAGGALGSLLGGYLADWLVRRTGERRWSRRLIGSGALCLSSLLLFAGVRCESPVATAALTSLASLCASSMLASWWGAVTDISGRHVGVLFGLMNALGVPGAWSSPVFFGRFVDWQKDRGVVGRAQWDPAFLVCSAALLAGAAGWLLVDSTRSAVEPPEAC